MSQTTDADDCYELVEYYLDFWLLLYSTLMIRGLRLKFSVLNDTTDVNKMGPGTTVSYTHAPMRFVIILTFLF